MISRRCSMCALDWSDKKSYTKCPECLDETSRIRDIDPMDEDEAWSRKLHAQFERYYEKWDESNPPERLTAYTPEEEALFERCRKAGTTR